MTNTTTNGAKHVTSLELTLHKIFSKMACLVAKCIRFIEQVFAIFLVNHYQIIVIKGEEHIHHKGNSQTQTSNMRSKNRTKLTL